jgi:hypothetical protein
VYFNIFKFSIEQPNFLVLYGGANFTSHLPHLWLHLKIICRPLESQLSCDIASFSTALVPQLQLWHLHWLVSGGVYLEN